MASVKDSALVMVLELDPVMAPEWFELRKADWRQNEKPSRVNPSESDCRVSH
jgi:hypothetical protein